VEDYERVIPETLAQSDSAEQFARCALHVGARYAVPFASNHCFLHKETIGFNSTATTPEVVRRYYQEFARRVGSRSECVVMPPGSSWSDREGFDIKPFDFSARREYIDSLLAKHADKLQRSYEEEDAAEADFEGFRAYFQQLLRAVPAFIRARALAPVVFRTRDGRGTHHWLVDPRRATVQEAALPPTDCVIFDVHPAVLRDCARVKMFSVWSASKRLRIILPSVSALAQVQRWFTILDVYELDMLPLARNFSPRALTIRMRRWREPLELARLGLRRALTRQPLTLETLYPVKAT
jgi:UDP-MurNAc hydroxylase